MNAKSHSASGAVSHGISVEAAQWASVVKQAVRSVIGDPSGAPIALHEPEFGEAERRYVDDCVTSGWVSSVGSYVDRFEAMLREMTGAAGAVAVVNGTAALHVCLRLVGVQAGDEVLVPSLTFIATANAVAYQGAIPHFVDSDPERLAVDPVKLSAHLARVGVRKPDGLYNRETGRRVAALMVMHVFGLPADMDALQAVADDFGIPLVEDAAESLGSTYKGRDCGTFGRIAGLSFNGNKIATTGGGGAILTMDSDLAARAKHLTTTARVPAGWDFVHDEIGYNYRMPNLNAALGCAQMERVPGFVEEKRRLAENYRRAFADTGVQVLWEPSDATSNYWLNTIFLPDRESRDAVLTATNDAGFMTRPCWTPMHRLPMFADCPRDDLSVVEDAVARIVNLPSSPKLARI
ncbi:LegC family aminotransferase [Rhodospirillaceae bacterium KN72]|uniref:GDP-perosamine synthase n=1 Tax=Pacificispira spongiicola TaxID=2729598 RepID=A0A7Y0E1P1_9PROT|nr:LegC family aminotransferase [Pacificispira spongiicola]NMM45584.1 LegC family aminotransferase [Pacificispira spongiicola]